MARISNPTTTTRKSETRKSGRRDSPVLTTKHHSGFAMWPSAYGGITTKNYER